MIEAGEDMQTVDTIMQQCAEVDALQRCHGWTFEAACELCGLEPRYYVPNCPKIAYIPTPDDIDAVMRAHQAFRCGQITETPQEWFMRPSGHHWDA